VSQPTMACMDPFSVLGAGANPLQLIDTAVKVIEYLNEIKDPPRERIWLARELGSLYSVLVDLEGRLEECESEEEDQWDGGLRSLAVTQNSSSPLYHTP
jgi:hypothetical protein